MPRKTDSNNPGDWLQLAEADLEGIRELGARELAYQLCRSKLAEVLEKLMKAELIRNGWFLEKTHDLMRLLEVLEKHSPDLVADVEPLALALADAYFRDRYPGFDLEDSDWPDLRDKVSAIEALLRVLQARLHNTLKPPGKMPGGQPS